MSKVWIVLLLVLPGGTVLVGIGLLLRWLGRRRLVRRRRLAMVYLRTLLARCCGRWRPCGFPLIERRGARMALVEAIAGLESITYGCDEAVLRATVRTYDLEALLIGSLGRPFADRRRLLALLASLPLSIRTAALVEPYTFSRDRDVRFYALMARISADSGRAMQFLREFQDPLTPLECAELMTLVHRGRLPLRYEELLQASQENLRRLGLRLVRHFGIVQAAGLVLALTSDKRVGREALEVLCDLHGPLTLGIERSGKTLTQEMRRELLRRAAYEGYALRGIEHLLCGEERLAFERLSATYKSAALWT